MLDRFIAELRRGGRRRLGGDDLLAALDVVEPELRVSPRRWGRLRELVAAAAAADLLVVAQSWLDRPDKSEPPGSATLRLARPAEGRRASAVVWPPELAWAGRLQLRIEEEELLRQVRRFLRDLAPDEPVVPLRERSLQLTGDEKLLDGYLGRRLFAPGRLSLDLLRCRRLHPPFAWREVGEAPVLLVVENHDTYHSLGRAIDRDEGIGYVAFGCGNQFVASIGSVADLPRPVERILYFGDLDLEGLRIPARAAGVARALDLPTVEPAAGLYEALLRVGTRGRGTTVSPTEAREAASWLPARQLDEVIALLIGGERFAQEGLGYRHLRRRELWRIAEPAGS